MVSTLDDIPRGDTCPGVNRAVIELLLPMCGEALTLLDVPCGRGELLDSVRRFKPGWGLIGADLVEPRGFAHEFRQVDASSSGPLADVPPYDVITCVSGVMEFDNTLEFFRRLFNISADDATLIVSNDNVATARDRVLYLLFGRFRQFANQQPAVGTTWKILHLGNLVRILNDAGFEVRDVQYVIGNSAEWLWVPLAVPIFLAEWIYRRGRNGRSAPAPRYFQLRSLIARHYLLVCGKKNDANDSLIAPENA